MMEIEWSDRYKVGHTAIDNEHEIFVLLIIKLV